MTPDTPSMSGEPRCRMPYGRECQLPGFQLLKSRLSVLLTVPMDCGVDREFILDKYFKVVSFINVDKGTGLLAVDEIDLAANTVYIISALTAHSKSQKHDTRSSRLTMYREIVSAQCGHR